MFAVDASAWERCDAETSPERGLYCHPSRHWSGQPIVAGWSDQWITQLGWAADSPTAPVDARRVPPDADAVTETGRVGRPRRHGDRLSCADPDS